MARPAEIRRGLARRFEYIEWKVFWDGRLNRGDLEREFSISTPQASVDLRNYQEAAPGNIEYNATDKAYVATNRFRTEFLKLSPERYLRQLQSINNGVLDKQDTWFDALPPVDATPLVTRGPEAYVLQKVLRAIRMKGQLTVYYQSLTSTRNRVICPHSLAHDGFRWHVRAWCTERQANRDYVLARIRSVSEPAVCLSKPPFDVEWNTFVKLMIVAHPELSGEQKSVIEHDYKMTDGVLELTMRVPLAYYFIKRNNLDLRSDEISPERAQIYIQNFDEYLAIRMSAQQQATLIAEHARIG